MRADRLAVSLLGCFLAAGTAHAFCRTTTCDPKREMCTLDERGCVADGQPLHWRSSCLELWAPDVPGAAAGITRDQLATATVEAVSTWSHVACGPAGELPGLEGQLAGHAECSIPGFSANALRNINSISVVESGWPEPGRRQVALTTVSYNELTGEIFDADIELNAQENVFTVSEDDVQTDLQSALTHEIGHALGLDHSDVPGATMRSMDARGSTHLRTLADDDVAAMCSVYPPDEDAAFCQDGDEPDRVCRQVAALRVARGGCSIKPPARGGPGGGAVLLLVAAIAALRRREFDEMPVQGG